MSKADPAIVVATLILGCPTLSGAQEYIFAEVNGVQLVSIPQPAPGDGFVATRVQARTIDPSSTIATFSNLNISNTHQVWVGNGFQSPAGTAQGPPMPSPVYAAEWVPYDSHLLITPDMVGGGVAGGYHGVTDTNDGTSSLASSLPRILDGSVPAITGYGPISMSDPTGIFFLSPQFQQNTIDVAYLVTQDRPNRPPVEMTVGILGGPNRTWQADIGFGNDPGQIPREPITVPIGFVENRIGSVAGPTQFSDSFGKDIVVGSLVYELYLPINVAAAPDPDANYSVSLGDITELRNDGNLFHYQGLSQFSIPAGATRSIGPFRFEATTVGDWTAEYELSFNDGTVLDASFSAVVIPESNGGGQTGGEQNGGGQTGGGQTGGGQTGGGQTGGGQTGGGQIGGENGIVIADLGRIHLVAIPQPSPGEGFLATKVQARTVDPSEKIVTFENLEITGVHQVWAGNSVQSTDGTAKGVPMAGPRYDESWIPYDSHLLITEDMVGGGAGGAYDGITDTNDGSTTAQLSLPAVHEGQLPAFSGFGPIAMRDPTDAFFLKREFQKNRVDIAYLVTSTENHTPAGLTLGILGEGIITSGSPGGTFFGSDGPVEIPFLIPEPDAANLALAILVVLTVRNRQRKGRTPR